MAEKQSDAADIELTDSLARLQAAARVAGLEAVAAVGWKDTALLRITYPAGRGTRKLSYREEGARDLLKVELGAIRFLPDLSGFVNVRSGRIEVQVRLQSHLLRNIPGFEDLDDDGDISRTSWSSLPESWRLRVEHRGVELELSPPTDDFRAVRAATAVGPRGVTFKISGLTHSSTTDAVASLTTLANAFFFDLDMRYGMTVELVPQPGALWRPRSTVSAPPAFPVNKYVAQPVALYQYGRSARGLPLLSFLAFYQVLEFFFPMFAQEDVSRRLRQTLRSPTFDPSDDVSLVRLVNAIRPNLKHGVSERDQLRLTIRHCVDESTIETFIERTENGRDHFCRKQQYIAGLNSLRTDRQGVDLRDQVADRIYDIRCRIVHTKSDGGDRSVELLLPTGPEARAMRPDIELVRLAAQEAIVAAASPLGVPEPPGKE